MGVEADFPGHAPSSWDIQLIENLNMLATCGFDRIIRIWGLDSHKEEKTLGPFDDQICALTYHPESHVLAAASRSQENTAGKSEWTIRKSPTITGSHGGAALQFDSDGDLHFLTQHETLAKRPRQRHSLPQKRRSHRRDRS